MSIPCCFPTIPPTLGTHFPHGLLCNSLQHPWVWTFLLPLTLCTLPGHALPVPQYLLPLPPSRGHAYTVSLAVGKQLSTRHLHAPDPMCLYTWDDFPKTGPSSFISAPVPTLATQPGNDIKLTFPPTPNIRIWRQCPVDFHFVKVSPVCPP